MTLFYIAAPFGNYIHTKKAKSVVGTFTLRPRAGLLKQIVKTLRVRDGVWYNSLGLRNPGIHYGIRKFYRDPSKDIAFSIAAIEPGDWQKLSKIVPDDIDVELNISCPNVTHFKHYAKGIDSFLNDKRKVIIKLSPKTTDRLVEELVAHGFSSFHCCNTLPTEHGSMSGKDLRPYVENLCDTIRFYKRDAEIIAGGGIETIDDVHHYRKMGANAYSLGTLCFSPLKLRKFFKSIGKEGVLQKLREQSSEG